MIPCFILWVSSVLAAADPLLVPAARLLEQASQVAANTTSDSTILLYETFLDYDAQGRATWRLHRVTRLETSQAVNELGTMQAEYSPWYQDRPQVRARVVTPDGVEHPLDPKVINDAPSSDSAQANVYDDTRVVQATLPALAVGALLETEWTYHDHDPFFSAGVESYEPMALWGAPIELRRLTVTAPRSLPLRYKALLLPDLHVDKEKKGDLITWSFERKHVARLERPDDHLPPEESLQPSIVLVTGTTWNAIAASYKEIAEPRIRPADVADLVASTVSPGDSRDVKIRKLVALLHKKVRYTGLEFGSSALMPAFAGDTLQRGWGDCKDKATVLVTLLRAAGIDAKLALVDAGFGQDLQADLPAMVFNHAIVLVSGPPELWIDATENHLQVGFRPSRIAGRWALVVDSGTRELVRVPTNEPDTDGIVYARDFLLADYGPSSVVENTLPSGVEESYFRDLYSGPDSRELRESAESYVKERFVAEKMTEFGHTDVDDMDKPFSLHVAGSKAARGYTGLEDASVAIFPDVLLEDLPDYLRAADEETNEREKAAKEREKAPRTADWMILPMTREFHYRVVPPLGFVSGELPESRMVQMGPARYSYTYEVAKDGAVLATLRFDTVKGRYSVAEVEALRTAVRRMRQESPIFIHFDQIGRTFVSQGKVVEGLRAYRDVVAKRPESAVEHVRLTDALMDAGLCECARDEARQAIAADPKAAIAFVALGAVLQADLVCRPLKKGFDYDGAVTAFTQAAELDRTTADSLVKLALLYEAGSDGYQYSPSSELSKAVDVWREIAKIDVDVANQYKNNLLFDLMYAKRFQDLLDELTRVPRDATHNGMAVVATLNLSGVDAAIKMSKGLAPDEDSRSNALILAADALIRLRMYPEAGQLLSAASRGRTDSADTLRRAAMLEKAKRYDQAMFAPTDPRSAVQRWWVDNYLHPNDPKRLDVMVPQALEGRTPEQYVADQSSAYVQGKALTEQALPPLVIADLVTSAPDMVVEGDDEAGYRVTAFQNTVFYVVKYKGGYRVLSLDGTPSTLGLEALLRVEKGKLDDARKLLDWARLDAHKWGGDDPLGGPPFPHLWTAHQQADEAHIRAAVLSLMALRLDVHKWIPQIAKARDEASEAERPWLEKALLQAYELDENFPEMKASAQRLLEQSPNSDFALAALARASGYLKDWDTAEKAIQKRLASDPRNPAVLCLLADLRSRKGAFAEANATLAELIGMGQMDADILNSYAWAEISADTITTQGVDYARRAVAGNRNAATLHTLASVYARSGKPQEAYQTILALMSEYGRAEPATNEWFVFGAIAEAYGEKEEAQRCYMRVMATEMSDRDAQGVFTLAQKRIEDLGPVPAAKGGK
jgi:tetratricopeptide (TPR) repeat protein